jgi:hypothetical protein
MRTHRIRDWYILVEYPCFLTYDQEMLWNPGLVCHFNRLGRPYPRIFSTVRKHLEKQSSLSLS